MHHTADPQFKRPIPTIAERNRVIHAIIDAFGHARHVLILGHRSPDADCLASMVAVALLLGKLDKHVTIATVTDLPEQFHYLTAVAQYNSIRLLEGDPSERELAQTDTVVVCDTPKPSLIHRPAALTSLLDRPDIVRVEFDHHVESDSRLCGDRERALVGATSSACELVALFACKLSAVLRNDYPSPPEMFTRNVVLALLSGMVADTHVGQYVPQGRSRRSYVLFSSMLERMLIEKTNRTGNFTTKEELFDELQRVSEREAACYRFLMENSSVMGPVGVVTLGPEASETARNRFGHDTLVTVARGVADALAEDSGYISLVAFYDDPHGSGLIQFRSRRNRAFTALDLRDLLETLRVEDGGGHAGAVGFRVPADAVSDFPAMVHDIVATAERMIRS